MVVSLTVLSAKDGNLANNAACLISATCSMRTRQICCELVATWFSSVYGGSAKHIEKFNSGRGHDLFGLILVTL